MFNLLNNNKKIHNVIFLLNYNDFQKSLRMNTYRMIQSILLCIPKQSN